MLYYNKSLNQYSRSLRRNMTEAEICLWSNLKSRQLNGYQFYRQRIIGNYIVDFFCSRAKMVIEIDGGQHYFGEIQEADKQRDDYLRNQGLKVLRFTDTDVLTNTEGVIEVILENLTIS